MDHKFNTTFFEEIISKQTKRPIKVKDLRIENYLDEPGLHWSNPGIRKVSITTNIGRIELIVKTLHERSKREILVYRFLSRHQGFPIPKIYYTECDEINNIFVLITEFGDIIGEWPFREPQIQLCALLLAKIHSFFWDKVDTLPDLFFRKSYYDNRYKFKENAVSFLNNLNSKEIEMIEEIYPNFNTLKRSIKSLDKSFFNNDPDAIWTLIHGAFHPPEIVSRMEKNKVLPLGVDWENSRVGYPAEDLVGIIGQLADWGEHHFHSLMVDTYMEEMKNQGITIEKKSLENDIIVENIITRIKGLPWLWNQYLINKDNPAFSRWTSWFKESMPKITNFFLNDLIKIV
ncbi:MAG: aminoglycoside phosphotransferase family protein [Promethearchaeota archaeon]